jgi:hypothetical protein
LKGDEITGSEVRMHPGGEEKQFFEKKKKKLVMKATKLTMVILTLQSFKN